MTDPLTTADWERLLAELRRFAGENRVAVDEGVARAEMGNAHVELTRDGGIRTGMPLHGFEADGEVELAFDHERGRLHVRAGAVEYTFRRP
ncbi:MAG: hypothetical protein V5A61_01120 [Haloarculaceae archaeon]|jgi:hypothetical protein